jgi:hypothetical protein
LLLPTSGINTSYKDQGAFTPPSLVTYLVDTVER